MSIRVKNLSISLLSVDGQLPSREATTVGGFLHIFPEILYDLKKKKAHLHIYYVFLLKW